MGANSDTETEAGKSTKVSAKRRHSRSNSAHERLKTVPERTGMGDLTQRTTYANAIKRISTWVRSNEYREATVDAAVVRDQSLEKYWNKFQEEHGLLTAVVLQEGEAEAHDKLFEEIEMCYYEAKASLRQKTVRNDAPAVLAPAEQQAQGVQRIEVKFPNAPPLQNTWGTFDGNFALWPSFKDRFIAAVHSNEQVPNVMKAQHLKASVKGEAARVVGVWPLTDANYGEAWDRLNQVYNDDYRITRAHFKALFDMPRITGRATYESLRVLLDTVHGAIRSLRAMHKEDHPVLTWEAFVVYMLVERLDSNTAEAWELARGATLCPTLAQVNDFLEKRCRALTRSQPEQQETDHRRAKERDVKKRLSSVVVTCPNRSSSRSSTSSENRAGPGARAGSSARSDPSTSAASSTTHDISRCRICGQDHQLWKCEDFKALTLKAMYETVDRLGICRNCLKNGHTVDKCRNGPCRVCPGSPMHNSILCPTRELNMRTMHMAQTEQAESKVSGSDKDKPKK